MKLILGNGLEPILHYFAHISALPHLEQVCLDLKTQLIFSTIGEPRGRGKIERFFRTVNQLLLAKLPGYAPPGHKAPNPVLNFALLEREFESFLLEYHQTEHSQTKEAPQKRWTGYTFLCSIRLL